MHYNGETDWMDDFESDSAASGSGKQHKNCPTRDTRPRRDISSSSEYLSKDDSLSSKDARPDVSPLHMSEVGISAPPKKVSHSTLRGQLSETEADAGPAPLHSHATDVFSNNSVAQGRQNVNDELVEAISRNIAQQLHMLSIKDTTVRGRSDTQQQLSRTSDSLENESRTSSQREALNRFTQELQRYAEQSGAKGNLPIPTPTPPRSSTSLHTIAALLPFRSEFKAAGLAITSKDQKKRSSHRSPVGKHRVMMNQVPRSHVEQQHLLQIDGNAGCPSSSTQIPFPVSKDMGEFSYAMVDQPKPHKYRRKKQLHPTKKSSKPLPEPPHPDPSSTATEQSCRLSVDDVSPSTPEKDILDKDKAKVSSDRRTKYGSSSISPNHVTVCSRGFSGRKIGRPNVPKRTSSIRSLRAANQDYDQDRVLDRDVLRGLHIASSAACNEQIDSFIHEKTGLHIRQFLADLMPLESLGNEPVRESKEERSRRRRADIREVKRRARKSRQMRERAMV
ncbi:hypothetical protein QSH57_000655 [Fusarium oxysporum f. sp. vasinfectum]|nr:hypothetical protein QSH57_000655 [Fusarium oxysporum f. sp. vasinfectum]